MLHKKNYTLGDIFSSVRSEKNKVPDLFAENPPRDNPAHVCYLTDGVDCLNLPVIITPFKDDFETLFADIATYHSSYSPVSAYTHVISEQMAGLAKLDAYKKSKQAISFNERVTSAVIGMTVGEALTVSTYPTKSAPSSAGYSNCKKTLSYTIARALYLYPSLDIVDVYKRWAHIQELSGNRTQNRAADTIVKTFEMFGLNSSKNKAVLKSKEGGEPLSLYVNNLISGQDFSKYLVSVYPEILSDVGSLGAAFDGRIKALDGIIRTVESSSADKELGAVCIAFFCNAILPGSLSHSGILAKLVGSYPSILFWYGLFSGVSQDFKWQTIHGGLGGKIARDLFKPFSFEHRPESDISYEEFEVLSRLPLKATVIKPSHRRSILVAVLPGVNIYADLAVEDSPSRENDYRRDVERKINEEKLRVLLFSALDLLEKNKYYKDSQLNVDSYSRSKKSRGD